MPERALTPEDRIKLELAQLEAGGMSKGERALQAVTLYRMIGVKLPVPEWALREIESCYRNFKTGKPSAIRRVDGNVMRRNAEAIGIDAETIDAEIRRAKVAPMTLGEAFGVPDHKGKEKMAMKRRRQALAAPQVGALFSGSNALPRTKEGRAEAAERLRISANVVDAILPTTRTNRRKGAATE